MLKKALSNLELYSKYMAIPKYHEIMLPLLQFLEDQKEHSLSEVAEYIYKFFKVSEEEKRELLPSGRQAIIDNRIGWARTRWAGTWEPVS